MSLKDEFKAFILRGNVIDLAVGVVVGASFGNIVKSLVDDVLMPPIGLLLGGVDFSNIFITLKNGANAPEAGYATLEAAKSAGAVTMNIGLFLNNVLSFLIVATAIFGVVKLVNKLQNAAIKKAEADEAAAPAPTPENIVLLREIRDSLAKRD